ncbi:uncharacterized protein F4822DRAFT_261774 [Hypoxylon trugodes]|uniref:uncharacterized protein n=1 Tax=Hypoxylon trugodes TaxID=326681 RepID=UPI00218EB02E|nr:uncharacterized protein F4822DRAFT_261774 [Hypoxylon trugodes]KAI1388902.1 hypothetical protein F4822DRAFT_261774 [Hypoxylon trugodes]
MLRLPKAKISIDSEINAMEDNRAGASHKPIVTTFANDSSPDELGEDAIMPPVVSDIMQTRHIISPKAPIPHQQIQQTSATKPKVQGPSTNIPTNTPTATPTKPTTQIAVHIRSVSASPSHARQEKLIADRSRRLRPETQPRPMAKRVSVIPSFTQNDREESSPQPKKRGRPKGWRPGRPYADGKEGSRETASPAPKKNQPTKELKRRGRPPRPPELPARDNYLQSKAEYIPFTCEWKYSSARACPAELHNMKTLRKHVFIVHGDEEPATCLWGKCAARKPPIEFTDREEFEAHMEKEHFRSYMWYRGEGYQNDGIITLKPETVDGLPSYLFDKDGNQITPSVTDQQFEDDQHFKERNRKLRRLLIQMDENALTEEEYRKQTLGID